jgi:hypothetical protein
MSRCRTSCVSFARVLAGKAIDLLVPWPAAMVVLVSGAVLGLAPSGHGALAYDELIATRAVATPTVSVPVDLQPFSGPVFGTKFTQIFEVGPYQSNSSNKRNRMVVSDARSGNLGQAGGPVTDDVAQVFWRGTVATK